MWPNGKWNNAHFARCRQATASPRQGGPFNGAPRVRPMCPRRNAGRHCAKESSHSATLLPSALAPLTLWPRREVVAEAHEFRRQISQFQSPAFPPRCGGLPGGTTTPFGAGATELSGTTLVDSGKLRGAIAGGQMGFNWQAGMVVFGAEVDAQWSGQQDSALGVKIRSLSTGRARVGLAFDWLMPYVTAGAALVNARDDLTLTVGGVTAIFPPLTNTSLGWTAGAGVDVALSSNWSARLEYLHIRANDLTSSVNIPGFLGVGTAAESAAYRDNIVRVGLNYRIGPRGRPGVLERRVLPGSAYAVNYDFLPSERYRVTKQKAWRGLKMERLLRSKPRNKPRNKRLRSPATNQKA